MPPPGTGPSDTGTTVSQDAGTSGGAVEDMGALPVTGPNPRDTVRMYMFGHSLVDWAQPNTQVGSAMCDVARRSGDTCCADGSYVEFTPTALGGYTWPPQQGHIHEPSCWNGDFGSSNFDTVSMTEFNDYFTVRPPSDGFAPDGLRLFDQVRGVYPDVPVYLYEHWPPFEAGRTFSSWFTTDYAAFYQWFADIQDLMNQQSPSANIKLVPVGLVFAQLLQPGNPLAGMSEDDLFVDSAPHGTGSTYYIAGLIHYMVVFQKRPASDLSAPAYVHPTIRDNMPAVIDFIWNQLVQLRDGSGGSRIW